MFPGLTNALKGISGEYEAIRLIGAAGAAAYIVGAHTFIAWEMILGRGFDLLTYCTAFPGGLAIAVGGTAGAASLKDRNVASAKIIQQTGTVPTPAKEGPQVPVGDPPSGTNGGD